MSNYKSKHTGAQVDEAVSKVLNGEVGGGATPDWNAQKGEAGYIKNKPFGFTKVIRLKDINPKYYYEDGNEICEAIIPLTDSFEVYTTTYQVAGTNDDIIGYDYFRIREGVDFEYGIPTYNHSVKYSIEVIDNNGNIEGHKIKFISSLIDDYSAFEYSVFIVDVYNGEDCATISENFIPNTIARKSDIPAPIIINYNTIKDAANSEVNTISEQTWLTYIANDTYKNYDWIIQRDGIKYNCTVIPDYDNKHIQILYFTRNEIEGTSGPLGNAIMKYSGLRIQLSPYTENTYLIYKISNGGSLETREFVFGENYNKNAYLIAAAQMSGIDTIDCKWVYTTKADKTITVNGQYFHIENSITNVDAIFSVKDKSLTYVDGNGLINKVTFADNGSYNISKNIPDFDPVVWKYMCKPYRIIKDKTIPEDLANIIYDYDNGRISPIIRNVCYIYIYTDIEHYYYIDEVVIEENIISFMNYEMNKLENYIYDEVNKKFVVEEEA